MKSVQKICTQRSERRSHVHERLATRGMVRRRAGKIRAKLWALAGRAAGQVLKRAIVAYLTAALACVSRLRLAMKDEKTKCPEWWF
jgi:predicted nucleic acid-binding protein